MRKWSRAEKLALASLFVTIVAFIAAALVVPEVRQGLGLDTPTMPLDLTPHSSAVIRTVTPDRTSTPAPTPTQAAEPTSVPTQTPTVMISSTEELFIDDGRGDFGFVTWPGGVGAVRFTVTSPRQIRTLKYFIWGEMNPVRFYICNAYWEPLYSADVVPSPGWFEWELPEGLVIVSGDFFVAFQWPTESPNGPWLGVDNTPPHHYGRSYLGNLDPESPPRPHNLDEDYMIRVIVQSTTDSESRSY